MRWLALTLGLLAVSAALVGGIYFRDRDPSSWLPPPRDAAAFDVRTMIDQMACPGHCTYTLLRSPRPDHWVARIDSSSTSRCFDIDLRTFDTTESHGVSGVVPVGCNPAGA